jgi:hypothetical protein
MALKDLSTNDAADVLVQISPLIGNITSDEKLMECIGKAYNYDNTEELTEVGRYAKAMSRISDCIPVLLVDHRSDVFGIVAAVKRKEIEEVAGQSIVQTISDLKEIVEDEDLRSFFSVFVS